MIKAIVVDDEAKSRKGIIQLIEKYCDAVSVVAEAGTIDEACMKIREHEPDLVFLDVEMPHGSGFDLLKKVGRVNFEVIFVTAFDQYALRAIKTCALDYLLKPVNIDELTEAVDKAALKIGNKSHPEEHIVHLLNNLVNKNAHTNKIAIPSLNGLEFIHINTIIRCEADGHYTRIITADGKQLVTTRNLKEYESLLPTNLFFRAHHSHIINLDHIKKYQRGEGGFVVMTDGSVVDIAKRKKKEFLDHFNLS